MNAIDASAPQPRPALVWIICAIYAIGAFGAFVSLYAVYRPELTRLGHGLLLPLISQIIALLIVFYSWRLLRRGLLR
jgi:hypothetical protein